jgi:hypothetical protein
MKRGIIDCRRREQISIRGSGSPPQDNLLLETPKCIFTTFKNTAHQTEVIWWDLSPPSVRYMKPCPSEFHFRICDHAGLISTAFSKEFVKFQNLDPHHNSVPPSRISENFWYCKITYFRWDFISRFCHIVSKIRVFGRVVIENPLNIFLFAGFIFAIITPSQK